VADYLDSLIARSREAAPVLQPRVARLFEPVPPERFPAVMPAWGEQVPSRSATVAGLHAFPRPPAPTSEPTSHGPSERRPEPTDDGFAAAPEMPEPAPQAHQVDNPYTQSLDARLGELERRLERTAPVAERSPLSSFPSPPKPPAHAAPLTPEPAYQRVDSLQRTGAAPEHATQAPLSPPAPKALQEAPVRARYATPSVDRLEETERAVAALRPLGPAAARAVPAPAAPVSSEHGLPPRAVPLSLPGFSLPDGHEAPRGGVLPAAERANEPVLVNVSIGRIEVRAPPAPAQSKPARADAAGPTSLDDYLRRRNGDWR
jgi:hypothetical protein